MAIAARGSVLAPGGRMKSRSYFPAQDSHDRSGDGIVHLLADGPAERHRERRQAGGRRRRGLARGARRHDGAQLAERNPDARALLAKVEADQLGRDAPDSPREAAPGGASRPACPAPAPAAAGRSGRRSGCSGRRTSTRTTGPRGGGRPPRRRSIIAANRIRQISCEASSRSCSSKCGSACRACVEHGGKIRVGGNGGPGLDALAALPSAAQHGQVDQQAEHHREHQPPGRDDDQDQRSRGRIRPRSRALGGGAIPVTMAHAARRRGPNRGFRR